MKTTYCCKPDGIPIFFPKKRWNFIKSSTMASFDDMYKATLGLKRLNYVYFAYFGSLFCLYFQKWSMLETNSRNGPYSSTPAQMALRMNMLAPEGLALRKGVDIKDKLSSHYTSTICAGVEKKGYFWN